MLCFFDLRLELSFTPFFFGASCQKRNAVRAQGGKLIVQEKENTTRTHLKIEPTGSGKTNVQRNLSLSLSREAGSAQPARVSIGTFGRRRFGQEPR